MRIRPQQALVALGLIGAVIGGLALAPWRDDARSIAAPSGSAPAPMASRTPTAEPSPAAPPGAPRGACTRTGAKVVTFRVLVEPGIRATADEFATSVRRVLCDRRGWRASDAVGFRYDPRGRLLIGLRTPDSTERRCMRLVGLSVRRRYSCGTPREVVLNSDRWFTGVPHFASLTEYRRMLVNHEVGHALGLRHQDCGADGARAPVMMQQSKGMTSSNGNTCTTNPWPRKEELERLD